MKLNFASDYLEGAHPDVLKKLEETNMVKLAGYGEDELTEEARNKVRKACAAPEADVYFLSGGTQTNSTMIDAMLEKYQGVIAPETGHIETHEAGAIEAWGHKVITLPHNNGKISAEEIKGCVDSYNSDDNRDHLVMPGMVYISQPTEYGSIYSLYELKEISKTCRDSGIMLYVDGARLAYALACPGNDVSLSDLAELADAFYIGGTKCGALMGESVVIPKHGLIPHLFTIIKQHGALLAKGRAVSLQFDALFTDGLYMKIGANAFEQAEKIRKALMDKGYELTFDSPANQIFIILSAEKRKELEESVEMGFWENLPDGRVIMRIATSWATTDEETDALIRLL